MEKNNRYWAQGAVLLLAFFWAGCPTGENLDTVDESESAADRSKINNLSTIIIYNTDLTPKVAFTFNRAVRVQEGPEGWIVEGAGTKTLTAQPSGAVTPGEPERVALTAVDALDDAQTIAVEAEVMPVGGYFERPVGGAEYTVHWYGEAVNGVTGETAGVVVLRAGGTTGGTAGGSYLVADEGLRNIFSAIYTPNAPGSADRIEQGKEAAVYTEAVSGAILDLFKVTVGPPDANNGGNGNGGDGGNSENNGDRIEITGAALPLAAENPLINQYHPVVIDIGSPEKPVAGLPVFRIREGGLPVQVGDYRHIRFRVNRGASLVIEADNSGGEEAACPYGTVSGSTVEVMDGGSFRNGAYRGFPLGEDTVIIARLGSRLASGPETGTASDWIIGSVKDNARVCWGSGDQNGSYIEIRDGGSLAFDANIMVRKPLKLHYNVWFVNSPTLTIDTSGAEPLPDGTQGLIAEECVKDEDGEDGATDVADAAASGYRFYGTFFRSGGQNPSRPAAKIILKKGSVISRSLVSDDQTGGGLVSAEEADIAISNGGAANGLQKELYGRDNIGGYFNWKLPSD
jgi:hypothetical protein